MPERETLFCDVALPLHIPSTYTYRIPYNWNKNVKVGQRVAVSLGQKKVFSGIVFKIHNQAPKVKTIKYILSILDENPIIDNNALEFWKWLSQYYMCYLGDVLSAALPSALRLKSQTQITINPDFNGDITNIKDEELKVFNLLSDKKDLTMEEVNTMLKAENVISLLNNMVKKNIITTTEELKSRYKPKMEDYISLNNEYKNEENLKKLINLFEEKERLKSQYELILIFLSKVKNREGDIKKSELLLDERISTSTLNTLIKKEIFLVEKKFKSRLINRDFALGNKKVELNSEQEDVYNSIIELWNEKPVSLLYGVTGGGKTEIYIKLIQKVVSENKQVLFLLPEIALTSHFITRLEKYFGNKVGVYHSRFSFEERLEIWNKVRDSNKEDSYNIIIGSRSSIFLPFNNLGLVIVDEEHDFSYKQYDPAPRYQGRNSAIMLAKIHNAKTILGSATPSIESFFNAKTGKYQFLELKKRYWGVALPEIILVDTIQERENNNMHSYFSQRLLDEIKKALEEREQVILFQNLRGFAKHLKCDACGAVPICNNCDVSLTYHKKSNSLQCHYCGYSINIPHNCPQCGSYKLRMVGFGTEKIEEELNIFFPNARIDRLDLDSSRSKNAYQTIINNFQERKTDILIGTQMVTKGLDFDHVSLVGIVNADSLLNFPDFRATERAFQHIVQVSGRAGRKHKQGKVVIQTTKVQHNIIQNVVENDYESMFENIIQEREHFKYPPFYNLIKISLMDKKEDSLEVLSEEFAIEIRKLFGQRVLGPQEGLIARIKTYYIRDFLIKFENKEPIKKAKQEILVLIEKFQGQNPQLKIVIDVDPY
ncbi:MAG: primosomal protein N' [Bacteroidales bacterium]|jgi:primosomal protein N' (replication factor Y)|nr:primosomal protein N' [Bacteroidales bacterium]